MFLFCKKISNNVFFYLKPKSVISHNMYIITMVLFPNIFYFPNNATAQNGC